MPTVDVVIPCFNKVHLTRQCVESIVKTTKGVDYKIILVNDGSTDETELYFKSLDGDLRYTTTTIPHGGYCKAVNAGLKLSKADYVVTLNYDTIIHDPKWLAKMVIRFTDDKEIGAVGCTSNYVSGKQATSFNWVHDTEYASLLIGFCLMVKREVLDKVGLLDERYESYGSDDLDWSLRIKKAGWKLAIARDVFVQHIGHQGLMQMPEWCETYHEKGKELFIQKWGQDEWDKLIKHQPLVVIGIPTIGMIHYLFITNTLLGLQRPPGTAITVTARTVVHLARNKIVQKFLESGADYLFFLDDDMLCPSNIIERLIKHNVDIVSAIAFKRGEPYNSCAFKKAPEGIMYNPIEPEQGLVEVDAVGAACMLVHRRVLEKMKDPWFTWGDYGEDIMFCRGAQEAGFKIWCDSDLVVGHIGENKIITVDTYKSYNAKIDKENKEKTNGTITKT